MRREGGRGSQVREEGGASRGKEERQPGVGLWIQRGSQCLLIYWLPKWRCLPNECIAILPTCLPCSACSAGMGTCTCTCIYREGDV